MLTKIYKYAILLKTSSPKSPKEKSSTMQITVISRLALPSSAITDEITAINGHHTNVEGWSVTCTLAEGESKVLWRIALVSLIAPVLWPIRVTNLGDGKYRVSRPWPGIFGEGSKSRIVLPATTHSTTRTCEYATVG